MPLYELALMGAPSDTQIGDVETCVSGAIAPFGLRLGAEVGWAIRPAIFDPEQKVPAAVAFFGQPGIAMRRYTRLARAWHSGYSSGERIQFSQQ